MIVSDVTLLGLISSGKLVIDPFDQRCVQPASYDLRLSEDTTLMPIRQGLVAAFKDLVWVLSHEVQYETLAVIDRDWTRFQEDLKVYEQQESFTLLSTLERIRIPNDLCAQIHGRSSLARKGIFVHVSAGFADPGFDGTITLECINVSNAPVTLQQGDRVAQVQFAWMDQPVATGYKGRYQGQEGPTKSKFEHGWS